MLDSIECPSTERATPYKVLDHSVHLIGSPDEVRFVVVVSDVPDLKGNQIPQDPYEGRFRLNKSHLRDVFLGRRYHGLFPPSVLTLDRAMTASRQDDNSSLHPPPAEIMLDEKNVEEELENETLISSKQVSRLFFSYKSRRNVDHS
jgi:hypothetical protein